MDKYSINQRVREFLNVEKKLNKIRNNQHFGDILGVNKQNLSSLLNDKKSFSQYYIDKICNAFPEVNAEWLLTGEGEMLKPQSQTIINSKAGRDIVQTQHAKDTEIIKTLKEQIEDLKQQLNSKDGQLKEKDEQIKMLLQLLNK